MNASSTPPPAADNPGTPDIREAADAVKQFLEITDAQIESGIRRVKWTPKDGAFPVVVAAAVTRQHAGLRRISDLLSSGRGDAALVLFRPSVEEFIVLSYLYSIDREDAQALLSAFGQ